MKQSFKLMLALLLIIGCNEATDYYKTGKLTSDISDLSMSETMQKIYSERRKDLMEETEDGTVIMRSDCDFDGGRHEWRADNNFYYLTGFAQPGSIVVLKKYSEKPFKLYVRQRTIKKAIYEGGLPGTDEILLAYRPDTVIFYYELSEVLEDNIPAGSQVYIDTQDTSLKHSIQSVAHNKEYLSVQIKSINPVTDEMRVHKDREEIARLQKAIDITGEAFINACNQCRPGMYEFEIEAIVEYTFRKYGSPMPAFTSIIASGPNATTLHYAENTRKMEDGDLLLFDIGAEYGYYSADVSRTVPVNGKFTSEQKEIYELVLKAQKAAIEELIPGNYLIEGQNKSNEIIAGGLLKLGLMTDRESNWQKKFYILYPINHYLGMYVHDVGDYGASDRIFYESVAKDTIYGRTLEKGMVLTAEPGLYFRPNGLEQLYELFGEEVPQEEIREFIDEVTPAYEKYKNIGVRIEDDVLITEQGNEVLSGKIPKEVDDIERLIGF